MTSSKHLPVDGSDRLVYSVTETAQLLGISRAFAYELVARGELPVVRLGRWGARAENAIAGVGRPTLDGQRTMTPPCQTG